MDNATRTLARVLADRDKLRARMAASDAELQRALRAWSDRLPGSRGGIATEAGARSVLAAAGVL